MWLSGSMTPLAVGQALQAFLLLWKIVIASYSEYYVEASKNTSLTVGERVNCAIGGSVLQQGPRAYPLPMLTVYWTTILDILCYRGLQDKV